MSSRVIASVLGEGRLEERPLGTLAILPLPDGAAALDVQAQALAVLHPSEREVARSLSGQRRLEWLGGRIALRLAAEARGWELGPVLRGKRGEPLLPPGLSASLSHKRRVVAAAIASAAEGSIGLDVEELGRPRMAIASKILRKEEQAALAELEEVARWPALLRTFALKEAIYKALHPFVRRYVSFEEASIALGCSGELEIALHLAQGEGPFKVEAQSWQRGEQLWAMVRIREAVEGGEDEED